MAVAPVPIAALAAGMNEKSKPIAKPVATALEPTIKWRREVFVVTVVATSVVASLIILVMIAPYALLTA
jgi:hypothetical protein